MQIRFADSRPTGDYALVLPVAGKDRSSLGSLGAAQQAVITPSTASGSKARRRALRSNSSMTMARYAA